MKKAIFALLLTTFALLAAWSQPKVAVLDAIIPQNMDPSVQVPATEKIIEKLVQSNRFTVLDRANIESVLKEREFQVSGMVSDQDVVTAGKYLGADYVVVAKLSKVGDTNFISGKMINVKTGVIANQTSAQGDGKLSVLITLAGQVGETLAGGNSGPAETKEVVVTPPPEAPVPEAPAQKEVVQAPSGPKGPFTQSFIGIGFAADTLSKNYQSTASGYKLDETFRYHFFTVMLNFIPSKYIQLGIGMSWFTSGSYDYTETGYTSVSGGEFNKDYTMTYMDLNLLFRLPIRMGSSNIALVPMAGFEYDANLSFKDADGNDVTSSWSSDQKANLNAFMIELGAGLQINAGNAVIYPELLYGFKINSKLENDAIDADKALGYSDTITSGKLTLGVIVGFKLGQ